MNTKLVVDVNSTSSGILTREGNDFVFAYDNATEAKQFVSLTMPVRAKSYLHRQLPPVFEMQLPEGYLRSVIQKHFSKLAYTDDFGLLKLLAPSIQGRLTYKSDISTRRQPLLLSELLHPDSDSLFEELVERFALQSPLSGVQPKVLAQVENKAALTLDEYIVKAWGMDYPELALNEFFCMQAVKAAGVPVPEFYLSDDDALFIMKRFDHSSEGRYLGFEDMCVLHAKGRDEKYTGSYERMAKTISVFVTPEYKQASLEQFYKMIVLNTLLQNGDAHLKNFGVLYSDIGSVWLAPAYDVVSTTCYIKNDIAALTLMGSKKWWSRKYLVQFGFDACELSKFRANELFDQCLDALLHTAGKVEEKLESVKSEAKVRVLEHLLRLMREAT